MNSNAHSLQPDIAPQLQVSSRKLIFISMLFVSFLIISNLTAFKIVELHFTESFHINFPAALIFFPLTYFFDDVLTEVYGFKISRLIIWSGLVCCAVISLCTWMAVQLPASAVWDNSTHHGANAYAMVFQGSFRVFFASLTAYFFGEFMNSMILAKLKVITRGRYFSLRVMASSIVGIAVDTSIFCLIAFWNILPHALILELILTQYIFKTAYEFLMLPVSYALVNYLKRTDNIDYFDKNTCFNPFSLKLSD